MPKLIIAMLFLSSLLCGEETRAVTIDDIMALKTWPGDDTSLLPRDWDQYFSVALRFQQMSAKERMNLIKILSEKVASPRVAMPPPEIDGITRRMVLLLRVVYRAEHITKTSNAKLLQGLRTFVLDRPQMSPENFGWPLVWQDDSFYPHLMQSYHGREFYSLESDYDLLDCNAELRKINIKKGP